MNIPIKGGNLNIKNRNKAKVLISKDYTKKGASVGMHSLWIWGLVIAVITMPWWPCFN